MRKLDLRGKKFGKLTAMTQRTTKSAPGRSRVYWDCICDCGGSASVEASHLVSGTRSCGCIHRESTRLINYRHGAAADRTHTREYKSWSKAKSRCNTASDPKYPIYGGRGISMCAKWADSFENFLKDLGPCPEGRTLDRIDVNGGYEPGNCRWATAKEQACNKRANIEITYNGTTMIMSQWADFLGVDRRTFHYWYRVKNLPMPEIENKVRVRNELV